MVHWITSQAPASSSPSAAEVTQQQLEMLLGMVAPTLPQPRPSPASTARPMAAELAPNAQPHTVAASFFDLGALLDNTGQLTLGSSVSPVLAAVQSVRPPNAASESPLAPPAAVASSPRLPELATAPMARSDDPTMSSSTPSPAPSPNVRPTGGAASPGRPRPPASAPRSSAAMAAALADFGDHDVPLEFFMSAPPKPPTPTPLHPLRPLYSPGGVPQPAAVPVPVAPAAAAIKSASAWTKPVPNGLAPPAATPPAASSPALPLAEAKTGATTGVPASAGPSRGGRGLGRAAHAAAPPPEPAYADDEEVVPNIRGKHTANKAAAGAAPSRRAPAKAATASQSAPRPAAAAPSAPKAAAGPSAASAAAPASAKPTPMVAAFGDAPRPGGPSARERVAKRPATEHPRVVELRREVNPRAPPPLPDKSRMFVIKSFSEDDVHKSVKYGIWASTDQGNRRLDKAYRETNGAAPVYLFFSVNGSGYFVGMAQMVSPVDYNSNSTVWAQVRRSR